MDTVSHVGIFDPALWTVAPLHFSLVQLSLRPPLPCKIKYTVMYTRLQCVMGGGGGWYGVLGLRQINTCRKVPWQANFLGWRHFALPSMSLIFPLGGMRFRLHAHESSEQSLRLAGRTSTHEQKTAGSVELLGPSPALCPSFRTLAQAQRPVSPGMLQARAQLFPSVQGEAVAKLTRPLVVTAHKWLINSMD